MKSYIENDWRKGDDIILARAEEKSFRTTKDRIIFEMEAGNKPRKPESLLIIRSKSIEAATIEGKGQLIFMNAENVRLYASISVMTHENTKIKVLL